VSLSCWVGRTPEEDHGGLLRVSFLRRKGNGVLTMDGSLPCILYEEVVGGSVSNVARLEMYVEARRGAE